MSMKCVLLFSNVAIIVLCFGNKMKVVRENKLDLGLGPSAEIRAPKMLK